MAEKVFDLEKRTFEFTKNVALFCRTLPPNTSNFEYSKQVIRSSGSIGSNYIEANEALSKKDFAMRIKIARKEAKESVYWLRLIAETNSEKITETANSLAGEAMELKKILSAIIKKS